MKKFIVTTVFEAEDEKEIIDTIEKEFELSDEDYRSLMSGKEVCTGKFQDKFGVMYMTIKIEGFHQ